MQHSIAVGQLAQKITRVHGADAATCDQAPLAGMIHDVGKLVLACERSADYDHVIQLAVDEAETLVLREQELVEVTHAEVGAYLLSLWGIPNSIVETVAFHHRPLDLGGETPIVLTSVHLANALVHEEESDRRTLADTMVDTDLSPYGRH